jgi:hypothetical protein
LNVNQKGKLLLKIISVLILPRKSLSFSEMQLSSLANCFQPFVSEQNNEYQSQCLDKFKTTLSFLFQNIAVELPAYKTNCNIEDFGMFIKLCFKDIHHYNPKVDENTWDKRHLLQYFIEEYCAKNSSFELMVINDNQEFRVVVLGMIKANPLLLKQYPQGDVKSYLSEEMQKQVSCIDDIHPLFMVSSKPQDCTDTTSIQQVIEETLVSYHEELEIEINNKSKAIEASMMSKLSRETTIEKLKVLFKTPKDNWCKSRNV